MRPTRTTTRDIELCNIMIGRVRKALMSVLQSAKNREDALLAIIAAKGVVDDVEDTMQRLPNGSTEAAHIAVSEVLRSDATRGKTS